MNWKEKLTVRRYIEFKLGDKLVLWINPATIDFDVGTKWPVSRQIENKITGLLPIRMVGGLMRPLLHHLEPFVIPPVCYGVSVPVQKIEKFRKVEDFIRNRNNIEATIWYQGLVNELQRRGVATHKFLQMHSVDDIVNFLRLYVLDLIESMRQTGYCLSKGADLGAVVVNQHGNLEKAGSGNHRFYVAKILGVQRFPVRVAGVHGDWWCAQKAARAEFGVHNLADVLSEVERRHQ